MYIYILQNNNVEARKANLNEYKLNKRILSRRHLYEFGLQVVTDRQRPIKSGKCDNNNLTEFLITFFINMNGFYCILLYKAQCFIDVSTTN